MRRSFLRLESLEARDVPADLYAISTLSSPLTVVEGQHNVSAAKGFYLGDRVNMSSLVFGIDGNPADIRNPRLQLDLNFDGHPDREVRGRISGDDIIFYGRFRSGWLPTGYKVLLNTNPDVFVGDTVTISFKDAESARPLDAHVFGQPRTLNLHPTLLADLVVTMTAPAQAMAGDNVTVTMTVQNNGPKKAKDTVMTMPIPNGLTVVSANGGVVSGGAITWNLSNIASGGSKTRTAVFKTPVGSDADIDFFTNAWAVTRDPNTENNHASAHTEVDVPQTDTGSLFVILDSTPSRPQDLLGGTLGSTMLRLELRSTGAHDIDVYGLRLVSLGNTAQSIDRLELYKPGEATPFAHMTVGATGSDDVPWTVDGVSISNFTARLNDGELIVPAGQVVDVIVKPLVKSDLDGGTHQNLQIALLGTPVSDPVTGAWYVLARDVVTAENLVANDGDATAEGEVFVGVSAPAANAGRLVSPINRWVGAEIESVGNANPDADGTIVGTGIQPFSQHRLTAAQGFNFGNGPNDIDLLQLGWAVTAQNVLMANDLWVYNKADNFTKVHASAYTLAGTLITAGTLTGSFIVRADLDNSSIDRTLDYGQSSTFVLQGNILNSRVVSSQGSLLQASLLTDEFIWDDRDAGGFTTLVGIDFPDNVRSTRYEA